MKGFTLIELMIVVAIIGILASVAIGSYQDYTVRAQVSEALLFADAAKSNLTEYFHQNGRFPNTAQEAGLSTIQGQYVQKIDIDAGRIAVTLGHNVNQNIAGQLIYLSPFSHQGALLWTCVSSIKNRYLPSSCR